MPWRRGLAFAAIHFVVAFSVVAATEFDDYAMWRAHSNQFRPSVDKPSVSRARTDDPAESNSPDFDICGLIDQTSARERIIALADTPAAILTAWRMPCPARWTVSGMLIGTTWEHPTSTRQAKQRMVDGILLLLVGLQWLLIGGIPLRPREKLRRDPTALITLCAVVAAIFSLLLRTGYVSDLFVNFPMLIAGVTWLHWLGLVGWTLLRSLRSWVSSHWVARD